ncbi:MAG: peptidase U32 family protein, partial [Desulfatitalea sp.]
MTTPLELLAPAGDAKIGIAAIDHGADAVYIGAPRFSARAAAGNPLADIAALIRYAHPFAAKVYVALNTILTDKELPEALALIRQVYEAGADGLIIQDVGLLECDLPPIPLIASTQMHNATPEKVKFLEVVGFQRVILARELSLTEIRAIRDQTTVALECFAHGALCVSSSGQCYMSQAMAQRSGNRGV